MGTFFGNLLGRGGPPVEESGSSGEEGEGEVPEDEAEEENELANVDFSPGKVKVNHRVCFLEGRGKHRTAKAGKIEEIRKDGWKVLFDGETKPVSKYC